MKAISLPKRDQVPNLRLVKHVVPQDVALPFANNPSSTRSHVNDKSSTTLGGIIEETITCPLLLAIQIPPKSCHFAIEKSAFLFFFAHSIMDDFDLVKEVTHGSHRLLTLTKAFGIGANPIIFFFYKRKRNMVLMDARGSKFCQASSKEGRVNRPFNVKSGPLSKEGDFRSITSICLHWSMILLVEII
jgi:hypothetical protein